ncbi:MAG: 4Fe-4S binding protein, partial [Chloroflexi bacterium]|nr:4Fe-4S binding protein [Chloroflexota bacterium]
MINAVPRTFLPPRFRVIRDPDRCIDCNICVHECGWQANYMDLLDGHVKSWDEKCTACQRCVVFCPTQALAIQEFPTEYRRNANWTKEAIQDVIKQSETGGILLTGMGNDKPWTIYWDKLALNASQVTNPSIDPLREPMELRTYLGAKPDRVEIDPATMSLKTKLAPQVAIESPFLFSALSYGAISLNVHESLARAASEFGTLFNTGEGGLHRRLSKYRDNAIVQVASGRFGVHTGYLDACRIIEIKIGQGAKPGIGGHLPGEKVTEQVAATRMIPEGTDALSPAPQHDIYS